MATCNHIKVSISDCKITPASIHNIRNFDSLMKYFLYFAPNIDCPLSVGKLEEERESELLLCMINKAKMEKQYNFFVNNNKDIDSFQSLDLAGDMICFQCNRMVCKRREKESNLCALLRHIRNAFAHGRIYIWRDNRKSSHVLLEDTYKYKKEIKLSARIVLPISVLGDWKAILEGEIV